MSPRLALALAASVGLHAAMLLWFVPRASPRVSPAPSAVTAMELVRVDLLPRAAPGDAPASASPATAPAPVLGSTVRAAAPVDTASRPKPIVHAATPVHPIDLDGTSGRGSPAATSREAETAPAAGVAPGTTTGVASRGAAGVATGDASGGAAADAAGVGARDVVAAAAHGVDGAGGAAGGAVGGAAGGAARNTRAGAQMDLTALHRRLSETAKSCYPAAAKRFRVQGIVPVYFCISPEGGLERVEQRGSSGSGILDRAATDCVLPGAVPLPGPAGCYEVPVEFR